MIVDYIAYDQRWLHDLERKCRPYQTYYVAVKIPLGVLELREAVRGTSPKGHARSHYHGVYGYKKYDVIVNTATQTS